MSIHPVGQSLVIVPALISAGDRTFAKINILAEELADRHPQDGSRLCVRHPVDALVEILTIINLQPRRLDSDRHVLTHPFDNAGRGILRVHEPPRGIGRGMLEMLKDQVLDIPAFENSLPCSVELVPLVIHHLVVLEDVLANEKVPLLHLPLRPTHGLAEHGMFDRVTFLHAKSAEKFQCRRPGEHLHQWIFETQEEARRPTITLPP